MGIWQALLNSLGWCMAQVYDVIPNYAATIIIITILIRLLLLPFGFKQIKSMQHMQALQPKIKELQRKYKNNKQKQQEETMKLYKEAGVNPLGGCLPMLLTLPFLFAMYSVIRPPSLEQVPVSDGQVSYQVVNNHLPETSTLFYDVVTHQNLEMGSLNLQCSLAESGKEVPLKDTQGNQLVPDRPILGTGGVALPDDPTTSAALDCGANKFPDAIPYAVLLLLMIGSALYQQRQMTKANPQQAQAGPQAAIMKFMPLMFGIWGWAFPAGLIVYWTTSNGIQIAQQTAMLRAGHIGPDALERRMEEQRAKMAQGKPQRKGIMAWVSEKAEQAQVQQQNRKPAPKQSPKQTPKQTSKGQGQTRKPSSQKPSSRGGAKPGNQLKPKKKP